MPRPVRNRFFGKVTSKGQTTVPKEVRDFLGLEEGVQMEWLLDDHGKAVVRPRKLRAIDLRGMLSPSPLGRTVTVGEMNETIADAVVEKFERATKG